MKIITIIAVLLLVTTVGCLDINSDLPPLEYTNPDVVIQSYNDVTYRYSNTASSFYTILENVENGWYIYPELFEKNHVVYFNMQSSTNFRGLYVTNITETLKLTGKGYKIGSISESEIEILNDEEKKVYEINIRIHKVKPSDSFFMIKGDVKSKELLFRSK